MHAHLHIESGEALDYAQRAMRLAERVGDVPTLIGATNTTGTTLLLAGDRSGCHYLERSLQLALDAGLDDDVGVAYANLGSGLGENFALADAEGYLARGIRYTAEHDLDRHRLYLQAWLALVRLYQGRWEETAELARAVANRPGASAISRVTALLALGRLHARRGTAEAQGALDAALDLAVQLGVLHRLGPVRIARAEAAWLRGDAMGSRAEARAAYDAAEQQRHAWHLGGLAFWRWRAGDLEAPPADAAPPFALHIAGDWQAAAAEWRARGCVYEEALALADGDAEAVREALAIFERLGAQPMVERVVKRLRVLGVRGIRRGPRRATRAHPLLLTRREREVLEMLGAGLTNAQIGDRLVLSERTVAHHVSAILAKLGVKTRGEAVSRASALER
jgi:ATP/maltotriose-dependent transcriptional regulator MalT